MRIRVAVLVLGCAGAAPEISAPATIGQRPLALRLASQAFVRLPDDYDEGNAHAPSVPEVCSEFGMFCDFFRTPRFLASDRDPNSFAGRACATFGLPVPVARRAHDVQWEGSFRDAPVHYALVHRRTRVVLTIYVDPAAGPAFGGSGVLVGAHKLDGEQAGADYFDAARELDALLNAATTRPCL